MNTKTLYKVFKSTVLFCLIFFISDRTVAYILESVYKKQKRGDYFQTTYAVKNVKEDVLIFGSSRAMHHYVSDVFETNLNSSAYNIGRNGKNILYSYALLEQILTYHKPEIVILDVSPSEFSWKAGDEGEDEMIFSLLPYLDQPSIANSIKRVRKKDVILSKIFKSYPYNSSSAQLFGYHFGFMSELKNSKGYVALQGSKVKKQDLTKTKVRLNGTPDSTLISAFTNFLKTAKEKSIPVYVVVSPILQEGSGSDAQLQAITNRFGFKFIDLSHSPEFFNPSLFFDSSHLNNKGAEKFSNQLALILKNDQSIVNQSSERNMSTGSQRSANTYLKSEF